MSDRKRPAVPPPPRKTLLEWITDNDGNQSDHARPVCSPAVGALHARIGFIGDDSPREPLVPPAGLALPPLG